MVRTTVYCTNCSGDFVAELDLGLDGNHEITCPICGHIHYRVVRSGVVTEDRWRSSAGPTFTANTYTVTTTLTFSTTVLGSAWLNRSDLNLVA